MVSGIALRIKIIQLKILVPLTLSPCSHFHICNVKAHGACVYSMLQPRVRVTESLFFGQYLKSDCPVQVSFCTL